MGHACLTDVYTLIVLTVCTYYFGFSNEKNKKGGGTVPRGKYAWKAKLTHVLSLQ